MLKGTKIVALLSVLFLTACVSTQMKQFIGQDISEVLMVSGTPIATFDLDDGRRAFQYRLGGGTYITPQVTNTQGTGTVVGNTVSVSQQAVTTPSAVIESEGCLVSYIATRNQATNRWIVTDIRYPKRLVC